MAFSPEEKQQMLDSLKNIESWQHSQDDRIATLERAIEDNAENGNDGMRSKVNRVAKTVEDWQSQVRGAKLVFSAIAFLLSSGIIALLINAFTGSGA